MRRLVGVLCDQTGLDFHKVWVCAYHEHAKRTGFHPAVASRGEGTHLEAVAQAGQMEELRVTIEKMLTNDAYGPVKVPA